MFKKYQLKYYNFRMAAIVLITMIFGVVMINSADSSSTMKQCLGIAGGVVIMVFVSFIDYNWILKYYWLIYVGNLGLLLLVEILGHTGKGAQRWIRIIGPITIQPSELAKIFLILFTAKLIFMYKERFNTWKFLGILAVLLAVPVLLVYLEPDLSTTLLIFSVLITMVYCAGVDYKKLLIVVAVVVPLFIGFIFYIQSPNQNLLEPYQRDRIMAFIDPENYDSDRYQQENSVLAIGSGELTGKGLNNNDSSSVKNAGLIPEAHTDFIFSVIGEELGFVGCCIVVLLLTWIVVECIVAAVRARNFAGRLICCGVASWIAYQSFINIGVTTLILPNTGLPLPFFSYGLSSLLSISIAIGIVLNISLQRNSIDEEAVLDFNK